MLNLYLGEAMWSVESAVRRLINKMSWLRPGPMSSNSISLFTGMFWYATSCIATCSPIKLLAHYYNTLGFYGWTFMFLCFLYIKFELVF